MRVDAKAGSDSWRISLSASHESAPQTAAGQDRLRDPLIAYLHENPPNPWRLEFAKACPEHWRYRISLAEEFAGRCAASPHESHQLVDDESAIDLRAILAAMRRRGLRVRGGFGFLLRDFFAGILAALLGWIAWVAVLLRTRTEKTNLPSQTTIAFAVHREWSSRTRHLLPLLAECASAPILLLGRAGPTAEEFQRLLASHGHAVDGQRFVRPFGLAATLAALPRLAPLIIAGVREGCSAPHVPPIKSLVGIHFRAILGAVSRAWCESGSAKPALVVYGHTGTADTCQLEQAQQARGAQTLHVFHGISDGLNFHAYSSLAWTQSGSDARLHSSLGGYGRCLAPTAPRPRIEPIGREWLLLSNLLHPMNPDFVRGGPAGEIQLLEAVAQAAESQGAWRPTITWRPHPVFWSLSNKVRDDVLRALARLGMASTEPGQPLFPLLPKFGFFMTTPSTVAIDLLRRGYLAVVVSDLPKLSHSYDAFPRALVSAESIGRECAAVTGTRYRSTFDEVWDLTQPSRPPRCDDLDSLMSGLYPGLG